MEPISLATAVVGALTTFGTSLATGTAQRLLGGLDRLARLVRERMSGDRASSELVEEVIATPNESGQERLTLRIAQQIMREPSFGEALEQAFAEVDARSGQVAGQDAGVVAGRDVKLRGRYVAGRDMTIGHDGRA
jgi:hypothetical protein